MRAALACSTAPTSMILDVEQLTLHPFDRQGPDLLTTSRAH